jgi:hypothetical protein
MQHDNLGIPPAVSIENIDNCRPVLITTCGAPGILFRYFELAQLTGEKSG